MGYFGKAIAAAALVLSAPAAQADADSLLLFSHKHWEVSAVKFDDGDMACKAEVADPGVSFALWVFANGTLRLQFYSSDWTFSGGTANLLVQVDNRKSWTLNDAELNENSVLFDLPPGDSSARFLVEIAQGEKLHLGSDDGKEVIWYSLAGSRASMDALIACNDGMHKVTDGGSGSTHTASNPFQ